MDEFLFGFGAAQVVEKVAEFDRLVVLDLYFDRGLLFSHLHVDVDVGTDEARFRFERLFDADDFLLTAELLDHGAVPLLMFKFDPAPDQVALADLLVDCCRRGLRFLRHDPLELRLDASGRLDAVFVDVHLDAADLGLQVLVESFQHREHVLIPLFRSFVAASYKLLQQSCFALVFRVCDIEFEFVLLFLLNVFDECRHFVDVPCVEFSVGQAGSRLLRVYVEFVEHLRRHIAEREVDQGLQTLHLEAIYFVVLVVDFDDVREQYFVEFDQRRNNFLVRLQLLRRSGLFHVCQMLE